MLRFLNNSYYIAHVDTGTANCHTCVFYVIIYLRIMLIHVIIEVVYIFIVRGNL